MKIGPKERNLLLGMLGVILAVCAWFFVASPMKEKTAALAAENATLLEKVNEYQSVNAKKDEYVAKTTELTAKRAELLDGYAAGISREDEIMYWSNLERANEGKVATSDLVMSAWEEVYVEGYTDTASEGEGATQIHLYKAPVNYTYVATYDGVKDMVKYVYAQQDKKSIENISIAFDDTTGNLQGSMDINMYYLIGTDKEYVPYTIPSVPTGITNVFHSTNTEVVTEAAGVSNFNSGDATAETSDEADEAEDTAKDAKNKKSAKAE